MKSLQDKIRLSRERKNSDLKDRIQARIHAEGSAINLFSMSLKKFYDSELPMLSYNEKAIAFFEAANIDVDDQNERLNIYVQDQLAQYKQERRIKECLSAILAITDSNIASELSCQNDAMLESVINAADKLQKESKKILRKREKDRVRQATENQTELNL